MPCNDVHMDVLLVEDDDSIAVPLADGLRREGFDVVRAATGEEALAADEPDIVLLDLRLPDMDGLQVCRELRARSAVPIIVVSARGEEVDRVVGLELGADDYLAKPCLPRELLARVRARLRHGTPSVPESLLIGGLRLHPAERRAWIDDAELQLTGAEFSLLLALAQRAGQVVDKAQLTREALGRELERFDRSVDVHVSRLRRKLGEASPSAPKIEGIRGLGYQMIVA